MITFFWLFFLSITSFLMVCLGVFVLFKGAPKKQAVLVFILSIFTFFYIFFAALRDFFIETANTLLQNAALSEVTLNLYLAKIHSVGMVSLVGGAMLMASLVHFFLVFPTPFSRYDQKIVITCYLLSLFFSYYFISTAWPFGSYCIGQYTPDHHAIIMRLPALFPLYALYISVSIIGSIFLVFYKLRHLQNEHRLMLNSIGWWFIATMIMIEIFSLILPSLGFWYVSKFGRASVFLLLSGMFVAVTSYRAFHIKTAIHYSVYWSIVSTLILIPIFGFLKWFHPILIAHSPPAISFFMLCSITGSSAFIGVLYVYFVQPKLNHIFFRRKFQLKDQAIEFLESISTLHETQDLISYVRRTFIDILYASDVCVLLPSATHPPQSVFAIKIPLQVASYEVGSIWVFEKKNLKPYSKDELKFMTRVSHHIAIMLNNARLLDQVREQHNQLLDIQESEQKRHHTQEIARGIIHEVKNTHFAISNFVSLILNKTAPDPDFVASILKTIGEQSSKLHLFSKNYLHQELIKSHLYALNLSDVRVYDLLHDAFKSNYFFILLHNLQINFDTIPFDHTVRVDRDKFHLVLSNIFNNAALYRHSNSLTITLETSQGHISLIFSSPLCPENSSKQFGLSTGMGLQISQNIVAFHGGTLSFFEHKKSFVICAKIPQ